MILFATAMWTKNRSNHTNHIEMKEKMEEKGNRTEWNEIASSHNNISGCSGTSESVDISISALAGTKAHVYRDRTLLLKRSRIL